MKRAFKIAAYVAAAFLLTLLLIAGLTQTALFKDRLRSILVAAISDQINGTLVLGTIDGNFLTGVTVDSAAIYHGGEAVLATGKITLSYDVLRFFRSEFDFSRVIIERPTVRLRRSPAGVWNFERLFKPGADSSSGPFPGAFTFPDIQLKNCTVTLLDSARLLDPAVRDARDVDYGNFTLRDMNLQLSASVRDRDIRVAIPHASFYSPETGFELSHLKGEFLVNEWGAAARNVIVQSSHSYVELDASIAGVNLLRGVDLASMRDDSVRLRLKAVNVDLAELQSFLPALRFLKGSASLDLDASGEFGNLNVQHLNLRTYRSSINLSGTVRNLHDPENLALDVIAGDTKVLLSDLSQLMPEFRIPAFTRTGTAALYLEFSGKPLDFKALASLKGTFGSLEVRGSLDLTRARPAYNGTFQADDLSILDVTGDPSVTGSVTARGTFAGEGFILGDLAGTLDMEIDTSRINALTLTSSRVRVEADGGIVKLSTTLRDRDMAVDFRGTTDWSTPGHPALSGELDVQNINLGTVLGDPRFESSITVRGSVVGSGGTVDDASGTLALRLLPSTIGSHELPAQEIRFSLDQRDKAKKRITLSSEIADIDVSGTFDLEMAPGALARQSTRLIRAMQEHALPPDSVRAAAPPRAELERHGEEARAMDFTYIVHVKDLGSISTVVDGPQFDAKADLAGSVRGSEESLSFSCNGTIHHFFVGKIDSGVIFNDANISLEAGPISSDKTLERLAGTMYLNIGSCFVSGRTIDGVRVGLQYGQMKGNFSVTGLIDSAFAVSMGGQTSVQPNTYVFDVEDLLVGKDPYAWRNDQDVQIRVNHEGIRVLHAVMEHRDEHLSLSGILRHTGEFDMEAALRNYDLRGVNAFLTDLRRAQEGQGFSGRADATLLLAGTTASPRITFTLATDSTHFRRTRIGRIEAAISYEDELATVNIVANEIEKDTIPDLAIRGTVPINLAFTGVDRRFPDREQRLTVRSEGFDVSVLDPLIWELDRLSGRLTCDMTIGGTPRLPDYRGTISLHDLRFLFMPNNVAYTANGGLEPSGDKLLLKDLVVKNVPEDRVPGEARFEGSITIKDYTLHTFDITMYGKLLVMSDATRKIIPTMYGTLFAAPDARGLNLSGTLARPFLSGNLEVLDANIVFPPARIYDAGAAATITSLSYVVVDDTTRKRGATPRFPRNFSAASDSGSLLVSQRNTADEPALLDRLRYNLVIETKGTTAVKMIFTPNEELYAEMEGRVTAINDQGTPLIYGEVAISSRSYYNFLKKFDATGSVKFVGPWDNPELNIVATYEGYRQGRVSESDPASAGKDLKTVVTLNIGGTRYEPQLKMSMQVQLTPNGDLTDWSTTAGGGDVQSDAISFIVTGKFREDLTSGERAGLAADVGASTTTTVVSGFTSNLLSGILDNFVRREFPFIRSVDVSYRDGAPTVNVGASPGLGYLRVGGRILNNINNTNVSYQVSMGDIFNSTTIRNLFLEIQRRVENDLTGTNREDITNEARLYYRFSF